MLSKKAWLWWGIKLKAIDEIRENTGLTFFKVIIFLISFYF